MRAPMCVSFSVWIHLSFYVYILFCIHSSIYKQLFLTIFARHFYESANRSLSFNFSILKESIILLVYCFSTLNVFWTFSALHSSHEKSSKFLFFLDSVSVLLTCCPTNSIIFSLFFFAYISHMMQLEINSVYLPCLMSSEPPLSVFWYFH